MMTCNNCDKYSNIVSDRSLVYTGMDMPELDIKSGDSLGSVLPKLMAKVTEKPTIEEKSYTSSDIKSEGNLYDLNRNSSICSSTITDKSFSYSVDVGGAGYNLTYDLASFISKLPRDLTLSYSEVRVFGKMQMGSTLIGSSQSTSGVIYIPLDRTPATIDFQVLLNSSCGTIELSTTVAIFDPGKFNSTLSLIDRNKMDTSGFSQAQTNELLAAEVSKLRAEVENLKSVKPITTNNVTFPSNDQSAVINTLTSKLDETIEKLKELENQTIGVGDPGVVTTAKS